MNDGHLVVGGHRLEVAWHGPPPGAAPTLVFLHEGLGSVSAWRDFPACVAAVTGMGALVYSRLGYGGSDPVALPRPLTYMHDEALTVLPEVLDGAGVEECVLFGHSDGGASGPVTRLVLPRCGHAPHRDCPDEVLSAVTTFLRAPTGDAREGIVPRRTP